MIAFTPVRCEPATLEVFLDHAARVDGIDDWWVYDDNTDPASSRLLAEADVTVLPPIDGLPESTYARTEQTHQWPDGAVSRVAAVKNHAIDRFALDAGLPPSARLVRTHVSQARRRALRRRPHPRRPQAL